MPSRRHDRKRIEALLLRRERRGLTYAELAEQSGVPLPTLTWWAGKLRREGGGRDAAFVQVLPAGGEDGARVEILLRNGRQLVVREAITPEALRGLLLAVDGPC
jgi:transcriptional regulator with XRE-family HTH domain